MPVRQHLHRIGAGAPACVICGQSGHGLHYCPQLATSEGSVMWAAWDKKWLLLLGQELMRYALCSDDAEYRRRSAALFSKCVVDRAEVLAFRRQHGIKSTAAGDKAFQDMRPAADKIRPAQKPPRSRSFPNAGVDPRIAAKRRRNQHRRNKRKGKSTATQVDEPSAAMEMDIEMLPPRRRGRRTTKKVSVSTSVSPPPALLPAPPPPAITGSAAASSIAGSAVLQPTCACYWPAAPFATVAAASGAGAAGAAGRGAAFCFIAGVSSRGTGERHASACRCSEQRYRQRWRRGHWW